MSIELDHYKTEATRVSKENAELRKRIEDITEELRIALHMSPIKEAVEELTTLRLAGMHRTRIEAGMSMLVNVVQSILRQ